MTGKVKFFDKKNGFGFVTNDNRDYFFAYYDIVGKKHRHCDIGQVVSFIPQRNAKGYRALEVEAI